jgi:NAD-dependent dihydropyrimidine dehydrogenase PreA subunit
MAGMFIEVTVDAKIADDRELAKKLDEVCPVGIFDSSGETLRIAEENLDECVLCDLCLEVGPKGAVQVRKLYE